MGGGGWLGGGVRRGAGRVGGFGGFPEGSGRVGRGALGLGFGGCLVSASFGGGWVRVSSHGGGVLCSGLGW